MNMLYEVCHPSYPSEIDTLVHVVNEAPLPGFEVSASPELMPGQLMVTPAQELPCRHVLHISLPAWDPEDPWQGETLAQLYQDMLLALKQLECSRAALPLLGADKCGFPLALSLHIARQEMDRFLLSQPGMDIYLVIREHQVPAYLRTLDLRRNIRSYLDQKLDDTALMSQPFETTDRTILFPPSPPVCCEEELPMADPAPQPKRLRPSQARLAPRTSRPVSRPKARRPSFFGALMDLLTSRNLPVQEEEDWERCIDESFPEMLMRLIDERGMTDAQCYNKAGIDRRVFARIRSGKDSSGRPYQPSKPTALAFAVALELPLDTTKELLCKAGYALSPCYRFDIIVEYFIRNRIYDLYEINLALYEFDQPLLGSRTVC